MKTQVKSKKGWQIIGGKKIYFRSSWEVKYAKVLQCMKDYKLIIEWEHEPKTFWFEKIKRGCRSYLPDFKVTLQNGSFVWIEIKGYLDSKSKTKIKRFRKYYPSETLEVYDSVWFKNNKEFLKKAEEYHEKNQNGDCAAKNEESDDRICGRCFA